MELCDHFSFFCRLPFLQKERVSGSFYGHAKKMPKCHMKIFSFQPRISKYAWLKRKYFFPKQGFLLLLCPLTARQMGEASPLKHDCKVLHRQLYADRQHDASQGCGVVLFAKPVNEQTNQSIDQPKCTESVNALLQDLYLCDQSYQEKEGGYVNEATAVAHTTNGSIPDNALETSIFPPRFLNGSRSFKPKDAMATFPSRP